MSAEPHPAACLPADVVKDTAFRHTNTAVKTGDKLLGTRIIPLVIAKEKMEQVKAAAGEKPLARIVPYQIKTAG
ncbi:MAG: hypothetical protein LUD71_04610 [Clostridiales bacterium]|nr:hypothetical protein [Clostridiales bacterium]